MNIKAIARMSWCGLIWLWLFPHQSFAQVPTKAIKTNPVTYEDDRVKIVVQECNRKLQDLVCRAVLTSKSSDRTIDINGDNIKLVDFEGNEYYPTSLRFANRSSENNAIRAELIENVPFKASFTFTKVPSNLTQIALLQIPLSGGINTTAKFRNFSPIVVTPIAVKPIKTPVPIIALSDVVNEVTTDPNLVCPDRTKILYRAVSKSYSMYICGTKNPTHYVGLSKDGTQGITLRLRYYDRTQFSADNGETNYTIAANRLTIRKGDKVMYQEKIQVLQALPGSTVAEETLSRNKSKRNVNSKNSDTNQTRSTIVQPAVKPKPNPDR